jgi:hypothetical protein
LQLLVVIDSQTKACRLSVIFTGLFPCIAVVKKAFRYSNAFLT